MGITKEAKQAAVTEHVVTADAQIADALEDLL